ncbi:hypothetical protein ACJ73_05046 [Blastomyces percursus]|uniref:Ubiquitin-like protease family profile domain-containing protein n=1 Tax=Blastomyces percursus TaxID=1658174 RepID=A0A1J9Q679_9EURO|nr:hypothetical protein ACJ73_05046 [Blastomyces percursus]
MSYNTDFLQSSPDDAYLSLTNEDVYTLKTDWLTDNVIAFWEEYLEREFLVNYQSANIVLLRPSMSFMLLQTPDPRTLRDVLPDFTKTSHIFLPINDCRNVNEAEGGTHWSLLLVSVVDGVAFHYDSLPPGNCEEALQATQKLSNLLNKQLRFINLDDSPVQENSSDCGVFVCLHMRHLLLKRLLMANSSEKISMSLGGMRVNANNGRKEIVRIIERFRKKGERRRSYVSTFIFVCSSLLLLLVTVLALLVLPFLFFPDSDFSARLKTEVWRDGEFLARFSSTIAVISPPTNVDHQIKKLMLRLVWGYQRAT